MKTLKLTGGKWTAQANSYKVFFLAEKYLMESDEFAHLPEGEKKKAVFAKLFQMKNKEKRKLANLQFAKDNN
jgi:hypothetical protein